MSDDKRAVLKQLGWTDDLIDAFLSEANQQEWAAVAISPDEPSPLVSASDLTFDHFNLTMSSGQTLTLKAS
jgi:hypothetical protein